MKFHYEIEQGSEQWHEIRYRKIGGTISKGLFLKTDTLLIDLVSQHCEEFEMDFDSFISADMQRGNDLEPIALREVSKYTGIEFKKCGWIQSDIELLGISPDGISEDETISCETKCPNKKRHTETIIENEIPLDNIHQCIHYFTVNPKLVKHFFASYRPESIKPLFVKELTRDSIVNIGTEAKPVMKSIEDCVKVAIRNTEFLQEQIKDCLTKLEF